MNYSNFLLNELYLFISVFEDPTCYNSPAAALFHLYVGSLQHSDILSYNFLKGLNSEADAQANLAVHLAGETIRLSLTILHSFYSTTL